MVLIGFRLFFLIRPKEEKREEAEYKLIKLTKIND